MSLYLWMAIWNGIMVDVTIRIVSQVELRCHSRKKWCRIICDRWNLLNNKNPRIIFTASVNSVRLKLHFDSHPLVATLDVSLSHYSHSTHTHTLSLEQVKICIWKKNSPGKYQLSWRVAVKLLAPVPQICFNFFPVFCSCVILYDTLHSKMSSMWVHFDLCAVQKLRVNTKKIK